MIGMSISKRDGYDVKKHAQFSVWFLWSADVHGAAVASVKAADTSWKFLQTYECPGIYGCEIDLTRP